MPTGILLYGPSGCGKTLFANCIAGERNINVINIQVSDLLPFYSVVHCSLLKVFWWDRTQYSTVVFYCSIRLSLFDYFWWNWYFGIQTFLWEFDQWIEWSHCGYIIEWIGWHWCMLFLSFWFIRRILWLWLDAPIDIILWMMLFWGLDV